MSLGEKCEIKSLIEEGSGAAAAKMNEREETKAQQSAEIVLAFSLCAADQRVAPFCDCRLFKDK